MTQTNTPTEETYDALNFDGLERRANYRFIGFREDMLQIFDKKDAASVLYQIVWRWQTETRKEEVYREINKRKKLNLPPLTQQEAEDMMYVYMSYNDFVRETGGAVGYNTVVRTLDYLVHIKKALLQKENHDPRFSDYEYSINKEVVRELLKELPESPFVAPKIPKKKSGSTQMGIADSEGGNPTRSTQMGIVGIPNRVEQSTQMGTEVYPFGGTSHNYTHTTHITPITEESVGSIERNTPPLTLESAIALLAQNGYSISALPTQGSEQSPEIVHAPQPTPVASSHNAPPFGDTVPGSGDSTLRSSGESHQPQQDSGFLPAHESTSTSQQRITSNEPSTTSQAISASPQRENEPLSTKGTEASELRIACDTPEPDEQPPSRQKPEQPTMKDRVEAVYKCYEQLCREKFEDENIAVKRRGNRTEEYKAIKDALESKDGVTPTSLRQVFLDMWNEKGREGDYFYRDLTHITIRAVCNQHGKRMANIRFREKKSSNKSVSGLPNLTFGQVSPTVPSPSSLPFDEEPYASLAPTPEETEVQRPTRKFKLRRVADIEAEIAARQAAHA